MENDFQISISLKIKKRNRALAVTFFIFNEFKPEMIKQFEYQ